MILSVRIYLVICTIYSSNHKFRQCIVINKQEKSHFENIGVTLGLYKQGLCYFYCYWSRTVIFFNCS